MNPNELNAIEKEKYKEVASELRCLVCQNQSIADSHASLAVDLKEKIAEQVHAGKTKEEIKSYMQERYGEFILYKPAYSAENAVLWAAPFIVLVLAAVLARRVISGKNLKVQTSPSTRTVAQGADWADALYQASVQEDSKNNKGAKS